VTGWRWLISPTTDNTVIRLIMQQNQDRGSWMVLNILFHLKKLIMENVDFGKALIALKEGKRVARNGWNGKGMFIFMRPSDELHIDMVIDKVKSLPQSVKDYYLKDVLDDDGKRIFPADENEKVKFTEYLCMKAFDGTIVNGWLASQTDMLSSDWNILDD
jgi:hypothetical protein